MKILYSTILLICAALIGCDRKPKEQVNPQETKPQVSSCRLESVSNDSYIKYNPDGSVQRLILKDSTDDVNFEEIYESFYKNGKLSSYNYIMRTPTSLKERSVSITYNANGLIEGLYQHEGLGSISPPFHKTMLKYDGLKNRILRLEYEGEEDGSWAMTDSMVVSEFENGRPKTFHIFDDSNKLIATNRHTYDANGNLTLIESRGGKVTEWRKSMEFVFSTTVKDYVNLLPKAYMLDEYTYDLNDGSKDINKNAITKKIVYKIDGAGNLLPNSIIDYQEEYAYEATNSLGYPLKGKKLDIETAESVDQTYQYVCK